MPDIAMCQDGTCPSRENCLRFTAPPKFWQCYIGYDRKGEERCASYWPVDDGRTPIPLKETKP